MASQLKTFDIDKLTGRIYTPEDVVDLILDEVDFQPQLRTLQNLVDPACGDGAFLTRAAARIADSNLGENAKRARLEALHGWDIDVEAIQICRERLEAIAAAAQIHNVSWNITVADSLAPEHIGKFSGKFDIVVANPPYVRIQHLDIDTRKYLTTNFRYCSAGSTDIFYAFFELGEKLLNEVGSAGFITPNSFFTSDAGAPMRQSWVSKKFVSKLINFGHHQIFKNASTYNAISFFSKNKFENLVYESWEYPLRIERSQLISYESLALRRIWNLDYFNVTDDNLLLRDICSIHVGIQTLADKVYFVTPKMVNAGLAHFTSRVNGKDYKIEDALLKPAVKASKLASTQLDVLLTERVIWPYPDLIASGSKAISEADLKEKYPLAFQYFSEHRELLDARDNGSTNKAGWFAFARQQGLTSQLQEKIVFPPMVAKPSFYKISDPSVIIYSGYFVLSNHSLDAILDVLESDELADWVKATGRDFRGGWKSMSKKLLDDFPVPERFRSHFFSDRLF